jgi:hypothetical protein
MMFGMMLYCIYVFAFYFAVNIRSSDWIRFTATIGALFGGWGYGLLFTAQGAYYTRTKQLYHYHNNSTTPSSFKIATTKLDLTFIFIYLSCAVGLRALSTLLLGVMHMSWSNIFAVYALVAVLSTVLMLLVQKLPEDDIGTSANVIADETDSAANRQSDHINPTRPASSVWYKATAAWRLMLNDRKMKYMIGLNAVFGLTSSFVTSYVNGTVVRLVLGTDTYVGVLSAWVECVTFVSTVLFVYFAKTTTRKEYVLIFGTLCFMGVAGSFILYPNVAVSQQWNWMSLVGVYTLHGIGRATFEGTLKATFADYFGYEKEGAFANIILQKGLSSALGFVLTFTLHCSARKQERWGPYCVANKDGSIHDVLSFETLIVVTAILAILGYVRSSAIRREENGRGIYENVPNTPSEQ